jgi:eukaryotic-like serine/threonine-protein kinase
VSEPLPIALGRYVIQGELGRGTMGAVYRAADPDLGRTVALKTVRLSFMTSGEQRQLFEKRFMAEARAAAGLSHPAIVVVHDVGRDAESGTLYIALEFLEGQTIESRVAGGRPLPWREALRITASLAGALHHAHEHGIVHRDVKPANVMLLPSGQPKLMDFGIAKLPASDLTAAGEFFGTPLFMSPEQTAGGAIDGRSDLFSLGSVLYLMLTGQRAFAAETVPAILTAIQHAEPRAPSRVVSGLPPVVDYLLARLLSKNAAQRYPNGRTLAEDIEDVLALREPRHQTRWTLATATTRFGLGSPPRSRGGRRRRFLIAPGALLLISLAGTAGLLLAARWRAPRARVPLPEATIDALAAPARLAVTFEHGIQGGSLKLWIDSTLTFSAPLEAPVAKKILLYRERKGSVRSVLDVAPGAHLVRVRVTEDDGRFLSREIRETFESGRAYRLLVRKEGVLKKTLTLTWQ